MSTEQTMRQPTADERAGFDWWNGLTEAERASWLTPTCDSAAKAWDRYKAVATDIAAAESRVVAEHDARPYDICVTAGAEFKVITDMARAMEAEGDAPVLTWFRDENDQIVGVKLVGHLSRETTGGMR